MDMPRTYASHLSHISWQENINRKVPAPPAITIPKMWNSVMTPEWFGHVTARIYDNMMAATANINPACHLRMDRVTFLIFSMVFLLV
jgi:hypothetical protein